MSDIIQCNFFFHFRYLASGLCINVALGCSIPVSSVPVCYTFTF